MDKLISIFLSLITSMSIFLGMAGSSDYQKLTGLSEAIKALADKSAITTTQYKGTVSDEKWEETDEFTIDDTVVIKKDADKDFVVLNITDTHFSDYDYRAFTAFDVEAKLKTLVASVKPDLITLSGDIVCSDVSTYYSIRRITDLFESFGIPWAPMFGNHDDEGNCDRNFLADIMMTSPNCLMKKGDPEIGVGNYVITVIEDSADGNEKIVESLVIMDCRAPDRAKQIEWFRWVSDGINSISGKTAEISIFSHIPLAEYQYAYDAAWNAETKSWNDGFDAYGECHETICYDNGADGKPALNGLFEAMKESETTKFFFCGHEHLNNFSINYDGIRLTYCMKIGMGSGYRFNFTGGTEIRIGDNGINRIMQQSVAFGPVITLEDIRL